MVLSEFPLHPMVLATAPLDAEQPTDSLAKSFRWGVSSAWLHGHMRDQSDPGPSVRRWQGLFMSGVRAQPQHPKQGQWLTNPAAEALSSGEIKFKW